MAAETAYIADYLEQHKDEILTVGVKPRKWNLRKPNGSPGWTIASCSTIFQPLPRR